MDIRSVKEYKDNLDKTRPKIEYTKEVGHYFSTILNKAYKEVFGDDIMIPLLGVESNLRGGEEPSTVFKFEFKILNQGEYVTINASFDADSYEKLVYGFRDCKTQAERMAK